MASQGNVCPLTTLGHPTVLACGFTRHNIDSGGRLKLATLTNLS